MRKNILLFCNYYLPGKRAGGPIQSIVNLVSALGNEYDFYIVTPNHEFGEREPFPEIYPDCWLKIGAAQVYYLSCRNETPARIRRLIQEVSPALIYLQSFFSPSYTILPLAVNTFVSSLKIPVLLAPRGEFSPAALGHSYVKKKLYLMLFKLLSGQKDVCFHASTAEEAECIRSVLGNRYQIFTTLNVPGRNVIGEVVLPSNQEKLRLCYLARIVPHKNLLLLLEILKHCSLPLTLDVYGPLEEKSYWDKCSAAIANLPDNVRVEYKGILENEQVVPSLGKYDLFVLLTKSENFGHSIHEALRAGTPVITSTNTPWHQLDCRNAGWEISLENAEKVLECLRSYYDASHEEKLAMHQAALRYGIESSDFSKILVNTKAMFERMTEFFCKRN